MSQEPATLPRDLARVGALAQSVRDAGGRALIVGGFARDEALRRLGGAVASQDIDVEVYGLSFEELLPLLHRIGRVDVVGAAFSVAKISGTSIDVSIPRRESKVAPGHRGFEVAGDPTMSVRDAMRRRDFTVNALALDPLTGEIIDEHGGTEDLRARVLRATDPVRFGDDALRALRAMQLAARFDMRVEPATAELCRTLDLSELAPERIGEEWTKLLLRAARPAIGLRTGRYLGVVQRLHPELDALVGTPQDPEWHPEGDVWVHTLLAVDAAAAALEGRADLGEDDRLAVMLGTLCHDLGKPATTRHREDGRIISHGHAMAGLEPAGAFLAALRMPGDVTDMVLKLVLHHLWPTLTPVFTDRAVRRLARHLVPATIDLLALVAAADHAGRGQSSVDQFARGNELRARATELGVLDVVEPPLVMGRHLVELGLAPGPRYARILDFLYDAQEAGTFRDVAGGLAHLRASGMLDATHDATGDSRGPRRRRRRGARSAS